MGVGAAGLAGLLAACGGGDDDGQPAAGTTDANRTQDPTDDPAQSPDGDPTMEDTSPPSEPDETSNGNALAAAGDVPVGGGVILDGPGVVVTQPVDGEFAAFSATCTHQGCTVAEVGDGLITCPCHGSQYSVEDGSVQRGPAEGPLPEVPIVVEGGQILRG